MAEQSDLFGPRVAEAPALSVIGATADPCAELRERFAAFGPTALDEGDTLALILVRCLRPGANAICAADTLMARFGGLGRVFGTPEPELARVVGGAAARELSLLHGLLVRVLEHPLRQRTVLGSYEAVKTYLRARLAALPREVFHVLFLDKRNQLIADERLGVGTVDHAPVYPREVARRSLELSASAILLAHYVARHIMRIMCPAPLCGRSPLSRCCRRVCGGQRPHNGWQAEPALRWRSGRMGDCRADGRAPRVGTRGVRSAPTAS